MAAGRREKGRIPADKWRKHMHWFSLTRFHAEVVSNDTDVSTAGTYTILDLQLTGLYAEGKALSFTSQSVSFP